MVDKQAPDTYRADKQWTWQQPKPQKQEPNKYQTEWTKQMEKEWKKQDDGSFRKTEATDKKEYSNHFKQRF